MLTILLYVLAYIGTSYTLMAGPCLIWYNRSRPFSEGETLATTFFVAAPVAWPVFVTGMAIEGGIWLRDCIRKLTGRD